MVQYTYNKNRRFTKKEMSLLEFEDRVLNKTKKMMIGVASIMVKDIDKHFKNEEDPQGRKWDKLAKGTVARRKVRNTGKNPKMLYDTGLLKEAFGTKGITFIDRGDTHTVDIGTKYAKRMASKSKKAAREELKNEKAYPKRWVNKKAAARKRAEEHKKTAEKYLNLGEYAYRTNNKVWGKSMKKPRKFAEITPELNKQVREYIVNYILRHGKSKN